MMKKNYLELRSLDAYKTAYDLSNYIWDIVIKWDSFSKYTLGRQFVNAADSISANVAEGFGRYHKKDKMKFYRISKGSLYETIDWLNKSHDRQLISDAEYNSIKDYQNKLPLQLNQLIKYTDMKLKI